MPMKEKYLPPNAQNAKWAAVYANERKIFAAYSREIIFFKPPIFKKNRQLYTYKLIFIFQMS